MKAYSLNVDLATQDVFLNKIEKIVRKIEKFVVKIDEGWFSIVEMKTELKWSQWLTCIKLDSRQQYPKSC